MHPLLAKLAPEPFAAGFDAEYLWRDLAAPQGVRQAADHERPGWSPASATSTPAKCCFSPAIRPRRQGRSLKRDEVARLVAAIRKVLTQAIRVGGTTLRDYVNPDGNPGYFRQKLYVYERAGEPCRRLRHPDPQASPRDSARPTTARPARGRDRDRGHHRPSGQADPVMKRLIAAAGPFAMETREEHSPFEALARAIAHQQLNGKAAQSILNRFVATCGQGLFPQPERCSRWRMRRCAPPASRSRRSPRCAIWPPRRSSGIVPLREHLHG